MRDLDGDDEDGDRAGPPGEVLASSLGEVVQVDDPRREEEAAGKGRRGAHSRDDPGRGEQDVERDGCQGIL